MTKDEHAKVLAYLESLWKGVAVWKLGAVDGLNDVIAIMRKEPQGWMPIETAPKDEPILVGPTKRMGICVAMNDSRDGWVTETCSEWINIYTPTHWMPLPPPPGKEPPQVSDAEKWKQAVMLAYGHLWHVNNEPMAPIPMRSPEKAAYAARKVLLDLLTHEERGLAINEVRALLERNK